MVELPGDLGFFHEPSQDLRVEMVHARSDRVAGSRGARFRAEDDLHRDLAPQVLVASGENRTHAPSRDGLPDPVARVRGTPLPESLDRDRVR